VFFNYKKKPSFQKPTGKTSVKNLSKKFLFELDKDQCPKGTVPVRRTTKEELVREKKLLNSSIFVQDIPGVHVCCLFQLNFKFPWFIYKLHLFNYLNLLNFVARRGSCFFKIWSLL